MNFDMAQASLSTFGTYAAGGVGLVSAVVAQSTREVDPPLANGAMALGAASVIAAAGPHLMATVKLWFDDRRDQRASTVIDVVNKLNRANLRLIELEKIAAHSEELARTAMEVEARYQQSQADLDELRETIAGLIPPVAENQDDLRRIATGWKHPGPPSLKAGTNPSPIPPPPLRSSSSGIHPVVTLPVESKGTE